MSNANPNQPAFLKAALGPSSDCPDLAALAGANLSADLRQHLAGCSHCRTELAALREFESAEPRGDELASVKWIQSELVRRAPQFANTASAASPKTASPLDRLRLWGRDLFSPPRRMQLSLAAASLLLVAATGVYLHRSGEPPLSAPSGQPVWRSGQFAAVSPVGDITQTPAEFRWESVAGAAEYEIQVTEVDGTAVWSAKSAQTKIETPESIRRFFQPGRTLQWTVVARNAAYEKIASTDSQIVHILATTR
jgi:hypothetical protein